MPRITHLYYSARREQLRKIWASGGWEFSLLTAREQWDLHEYYVITQDMTDQELRLHRRLVKQVDPSLPQRAGRTYAKLQWGRWFYHSHQEADDHRPISREAEAGSSAICAGAHTTCHGATGTNPNLGAAGAGRPVGGVRQRWSYGRRQSGYQARQVIYRWRRAWQLPWPGRRLRLDGGA
jgi:hypothetical protein